VTGDNESNSTLVSVSFDTQRKIMHSNAENCSSCSRRDCCSTGLIRICRTARPTSGKLQQRVRCAYLVETHEPRVACDVSRDYGG
jgi:hypothetical protein